MDLGFAAVQEADGDWGDDDEKEAELSAEPQASPSVQPAGPQHGTAVAALPPPQAALEDVPARSAAPGVASASGEAHTLSASSREPNGDGLPPKSRIHSNSRTRYFVVKSNNHKNLVLSVENSVWATQRHNEEKLNEAFSNAPHVVLLFSVNMSGCFQGYAKMVSPVGSSKKGSVFNGFGRAFDVRWLRLDDLDFTEVANISNPFNENKSVKVSRDGQELPNEVGRRVCEMVDYRVYRTDPSNYITDEKEVETGGFGPPLLSQRPAESLQLPLRPLAEPMPVGTVFGRAADAPTGWGPGAAPLSAVPPQLGAPPTAPVGPNGFPAAPGTPGWNPWAFPGAWPYQHWGPSSESSYSSSSYSSYSYSDSEDDEAAAVQSSRAPSGPGQLPVMAQAPLQAPVQARLQASPQASPQAMPQLRPALPTPQPAPLPAVPQPVAPVAAAPASLTTTAKSARSGRERTKVKEEKVAKEAKKAKEAKTVKEAKATVKQPKEEPKEQTVSKEAKASKEKGQKSDRKDKHRAKKEEANKSSREVTEEGHKRRSSREEAAGGRREKRQRVVLKEATEEASKRHTSSRRSSHKEVSEVHREKGDKVVLKEAKDCDAGEERASRHRRRHGRRHSDTSVKQDPGPPTASGYPPPRGPLPQQHPGAPSGTEMGAPPPDQWRGPAGQPHLGAPPRGHPPSHWLPPTGYGLPPPHGHNAHPPPRPLSPPVAGAPDWRSHIVPRGPPPRDWHGACPVKS